MEKKFVADDFKVPELLETEDFRIRMLSAKDADKDYKAVMSSIDYLKKVPTPPRCGDWPYEELTLEEDLGHLKRHEEEHLKREAFTYAVMTPDETKCIGCIYFLPSEDPKFDVQIYFWVTKDAFDNGLDDKLFGVIKNWLKDKWPFKQISFPGR
ncbi:MAG: GNAT family N-acetyltransferase [Candidatus Woesearchaeota archaeon]